MRISDWSSDVCSSDLHDEGQLEEIEEEGQHEDQDVDDDQEAGFATRYTGQQVFDPEIAVDRAEDQAKTGDRKSVVQGKSVSVRVDLGGRRIIKKKNTERNERTHRDKKELEEKV